MANPPEQQGNRRRRKGPRPKHVPQRTCISCREKGDKRGLVRIVRTPEHQVVIDSTGKRNGRGAYLCHRPKCWERAISSPLLGRALNTNITEDTQEELRKFAAALDDEASDRTAAAS